MTKIECGAEVTILLDSRPSVITTACNFLWKKVLTIILEIVKVGPGGMA